MFLNLLMLRRNLFERPAQKRTVGLNRPVPGEEAAHFAGDLNEPKGLPQMSSKRQAAGCRGR